MSKKISQREAVRLRKLVEVYERDRKYQRNRWASNWGANWINIETLNLSPESFAKINTARLLGHAVIVLPGNGTQVMLYAERLP